ncbi:SGNH/GDSL hydrolase family protein [Azohydromonas aeria]|uniref:SGNH/GDSL hydrolase family protein n=1 Tax=Azohydromonas aeria TaxID=2590212 RepID=UPI0012FAD087|nr:SGNH/GDSL hydrolase family protein [Azohydromonas aeria]
MRMKQWIRNTLAAAVTAALLAGCGGGGGGDNDDDSGPVPSYARLVSFGDSLSDVGTYRTAGLAAQGGGQFTINDFNPATRPKAGTNWTEQLAYELALPAPCAARTGLNASGSLAGLAQAQADHAGCFNYAQGGARVTEAIGPGNAALLLMTPPNLDGELGALTQPVKDQIAHHLAVSGGSFAATDLVTVLAGGNDVFMQVAALRAKVAAGADPTVAAQEAGAALQQAGGELAALVLGQMVGKGAQRVVVALLPDVGASARAKALPPQQRELLSRLSLAFNAPLVAALSGNPRVLVVDAYTASELQALDPARYGLTNVSQSACLVDTALFCSAATLRPGVDVSRYWFADDIHLTPYGYQLLARTATDTMTKAGWLAPYGQRPCNGTTGFSCALAPLP